MSRSKKLQEVNQSVQEMNKVMEENGLSALRTKNASLSNGVADEYFEIKKSFEELCSKRKATKTLLGSVGCLKSLLSIVHRPRTRFYFLRDCKIRIEQPVPSRCRSSTEANCESRAVRNERSVLITNSPSITRQTQEDERVCESLSLRINVNCLSEILILGTKAKY